MSFIGPILPAWGYHLKTDFTVIGYYFLSLYIGILIASRIAPALRPKVGVKALLTVASLAAVAAFVLLSISSPPAPDWQRFAGFFLIGCADGMLNTGVFHAISPLYRHDRAATLNLAGTFFGIGCLVTALLVSSIYNTTTASTILLILAVIPALFAIIFWRSSFPREA